MKPPICHLCNRDFLHTSHDGDLVRFADYEPLPPEVDGHPCGLEWFCADHLEAARMLATLTSAEAMVSLRARFVDFPPYDPDWRPSLWVTAMGPGRIRVLSLFRQANRVSPLEAKVLCAEAEFEFAKGWPYEFEPWRQALSKLGASAEIRKD